ILPVLRRLRSPRPNLAFGRGAGVTLRAARRPPSPLPSPLSMVIDGTSGDRAVRLLLSLVIVALVAALVYVIIVPAQKAAAEQEMTARSRQRLSATRTALTSYREQN